MSSYFYLLSAKLYSIQGVLVLLGCILKESDDVVTVLWLLKTSEGHLSSRNVLLWVFKVIEQSVLIPCDALLYVGFRVAESFRLACFATEKTVKVWTNLVAFTCADVVTLSASVSVSGAQWRTTSPSLPSLEKTCTVWVGMLERLIKSQPPLTPFQLYLVRIPLFFWSLCG